MQENNPNNPNNPNNLNNQEQPVKKSFKPYFKPQTHPEKWYSNRVVKLTITLYSSDHSNEKKFATGLCLGDRYILIAAHCLKDSQCPESKKIYSFNEFSFHQSFVEFSDKKIIYFEEISYDLSTCSKENRVGVDCVILKLEDPIPEEHFLNPNDWISLQAFEPCVGLNDHFPFLGAHNDGWDQKYFMVSYLSKENQPVISKGRMRDFMDKSEESVSNDGVEGLDQTSDTELGFVGAPVILEETKKVCGFNVDEQGKQFFISMHRINECLMSNYGIDLGSLSSRSNTYITLGSPIAISPQNPDDNNNEEEKIGGCVLL